MRVHQWELNRLPYQAATPAYLLGLCIWLTWLILATTSCWLREYMDLTHNPIFMSGISTTSLSCRSDWYHKSFFWEQWTVCHQLAFTLLMTSMSSGLVRVREKEIMYPHLACNTFLPLQQKCWQITLYASRQKGARPLLLQSRNSPLSWRISHWLTHLPCKQHWHKPQAQDLLSLVNISFLSVSSVLLQRTSAQDPHQSSACFPSPPTTENTNRENSPRG